MYASFSDYSRGDSSTGVTDLQNALRDVGYAITADGVFGNETENAVKSFQAAQGLAMDGIAGPATLVALSTARGSGWQAPRAVISPPSPTVTTSAPVGPPAAAKPSGIPSWLYYALGAAALLVLLTKPSRR